MKLIMTSLRPATASAILEVNLGALQANYAFMAKCVAPAVCGAVVKADAYGLGLAPVAKALWEAGAKVFFVATVEEGVTLRHALPESEIYVLNGLWPSTVHVVDEARLIPVVSDRHQVAELAAYGRQRGKKMPLALQLETGLIRLGLSICDLGQLSQQPENLRYVEIRYLLSHLACAYSPQHTFNQIQLDVFRKAAAVFPNVKHTLAGSGGVFQGSPYYGDMVRVGRFLYGSALGAPEVYTQAVQPVVRLSARLLQVHEVQAGDSIGYDQSFFASSFMRIATISLGYADGYMRNLSQQAFAHCRGYPVRVVGRISMDMLTLDVTRVPQDMLEPGLTWVEFLNESITLDHLAMWGQTISWEILTRLGPRPQRIYCHKKAYNKKYRNVFI